MAAVSAPTNEPVCMTSVYQRALVIDMPRSVRMTGIKVSIEI